MSAANPKTTRQAQKSSRTRLNILDATLKCMERSSLAEVTMEAVSRESGVSKGGIQYHFPSRQQLLSDAIDHLFNLRLNAYQADLANVPEGVELIDHIIDSHWKHLTEPEFQIYQQLIIESHTNDDFRQLLGKRYRTFIRQWREVSYRSFGWDASDPEVLLLGNVAQYLMDGMAYGRFAEQLRVDDANQLLDFVKELMRQGMRKSGTGSPLSNRSATAG